MAVMTMQSISVCFVCLGNICRSPTAEGVMLERVARAGLADRIRVDSAGTSAWHIGEAPDPRTIAAAAQRGYDLGSLRARQFQSADFAEFDLVLAMDEQNLEDLRRICPAEYRDRLGLMMRFATEYRSDVVPDPYTGGNLGFERTLDYCEDACAGLLAALQKRLGAAPRA
jgi:protein-tyrosine phosphatase